jgi:hypothetical protein
MFPRSNIQKYVLSLMIGRLASDRLRTDAVKDTEVDFSI